MTKFFDDAIVYTVQGWNPVTDHCIFSDSTGTRQEAWSPNLVGAGQPPWLDRGVRFTRHAATGLAVPYYENQQERRVSEDAKAQSVTLRRGSDQSQLRDVLLDTEGRPTPRTASETRARTPDRATVDPTADPAHVLSPVLPSEPAARKAIPLYSGLLRYFPDALVAVAECSQDGNDQHNPGEPLHWAREKSKDHHDCIARHLLDVGACDERGIRHSARLAWRALAALQLEIEAERVAASNT